MKEDLILRRNKIYRLFFAVMFVLSVWYFDWREPNIASLFLFAAAAYSLISALTWRVTVDGEAEIAVRRLIFTKTADFSDITHFTVKRGFNESDILKLYSGKKLILRADSALITNYLNFKVALHNKGIKFFAITTIDGKKRYKHWKKENFHNV